MNYDLVKSVVLPMVATVINPIVGYVMKIILGPQLTKQRRFNKIPVDQKVDIIERIRELKEKTSTSHLLFQIKLLYEQIGIYLPVWHSHKLIAFLASECVRMQDDRLNCFLKRPLITRCSNNNCFLDKKVFWITISIYLIFAACVISVLIYSGNVITLSFLSKKQNALAYIFFAGVYVAIYIVSAYVVRQVAELFKGMIFCRLFDAWLRQDMQKEHAGISSTQTLTTSDLLEE